MIDLGYDEGNGALNGTGGQAAGFALTSWCVTVRRNGPGRREKRGWQEWSRRGNTPTGPMPVVIIGQGIAEVVSGSMPEIARTLTSPNMLEWRLHKTISE